MAGAGLALAASTGAVASSAPKATQRTDSPALLGGRPVRTESFPGWPVFDSTDEEAWMDVLRGGAWFRGSGRRVSAFEQAYAELTGAKHCIAVANGTSALVASLGALEVGPGDEVILPPYTFVATLNAILLHHALPRFVDSDLETFQIAADKVEAAITGRTVAMIPVHIGGAAADLDRLLEIGRKHRIRIVEDACQAHLAQWRGRHVGTLGDTGCFSFQASKNLNCGEGGAILTNDDELAERCHAFHNNGRGRGTAGRPVFLSGRGANLRLTEFQGALLQTQMTRLREQSDVRDRNAAYLTRLLREIPGIIPAVMHEGCTRNAWHLYMFRFRSEEFHGLERDVFLRALRAEGIPCSGGYSPLNREPFLKEVLRSRAYRRIYPADVLDEWQERNQCPVNEQLCREAVWFPQTMLLGPERDMEQIAEAIRKIHRHAPQLRA